MFDMLGVIQMSLFLTGRGLIIMHFTIVARARFYRTRKCSRNRPQEAAASGKCFERREGIKNGRKKEKRTCANSLSETFWVCIFRESARLWKMNILLKIFRKDYDNMLILKGFGTEF